MHSWSLSLDSIPVLMLSPKYPMESGAYFSRSASSFPSGLTIVWSVSNTRTTLFVYSIHILYSGPYSVYLNFLRSKIWAIQGTPLYIIFSSQLLSNAFCMPTLSLCFMPIYLRRSTAKYGLFSRVYYKHNQHVSYATNPVVVNANYSEGVKRNVTWQSVINCDIDSVCMYPVQISVQIRFSWVFSGKLRNIGSVGRDRSTFVQTHAW
jgi:hypothetical protein